MNHAFLMRIVKGQADGGEDGDNISCLWKLSLMRGITDVFSQRGTFDIVHDHIGCGGVRVWRVHELEVMNLYDIGMAQRRNKLCLTLKTCDGIRIVLQIGIELFDSDKTMQSH